jgi:hypothetical protein
VDIVGKALGKDGELGTFSLCGLQSFLHTIKLSLAVVVQPCLP